MKACGQKVSFEFHILKFSGDFYSTKPLLNQLKWGVNITCMKKIKLYFTTISFRAHGIYLTILGKQLCTSV